MGNMVTIDGNTAVAHVAHATNEVIAIYPITPSSPMGEMADAKSAKGEKNIWGTIPDVIEMQSEGGASGAVHGALTAGALTTTFTASQGLLLMIPNMYKIAGELTSTVFHVAARSVACQALSIFGDHSDVMTARATGFGMIPAGSIQEVMDFSLISQAASLESRVPFVHFFDGFRSSHEIQKVEALSLDEMKAVIDNESVKAHRRRGLNPEEPVLRGSSQNPDVFFQARETVNKYYVAAPAIVEEVMNRFAKATGRQYKLFDYVGAPDAEYLVIAMGSGCEAIHETVEYLASRGEKVGLIKVRLYRPFSVEHFVKAIPETVRKIAVLDRTKEPGAIGEPLYVDVRTAIGEAMERKIAPFAQWPVIVGGRYGLSSKEFTPAMIKGVFDNLKKDDPKNHFTIGIEDDVTHTSLEYDASWSIEPEEVSRCMFYGLGADGTVGANKNSIKIIGSKTDNFAQGYFVYDSKKAGAITISHLRFGMKPIHSTYLINDANFVACHNFTFLEKYDMLRYAHEGATFLLNSPYGKDETWDMIPREVQQQIIDRKLKFYLINAYKLAEDLGLGARINTIMQTAFFKISQVIPEDVAIPAIKEAIEKTYGKKGKAIVDMNIKAVDAALEHIQLFDVPSEATSKTTKPPIVPVDAPEFVQKVTAKIIAQEGNDIPVSLMPEDGSFPTATTQYEKRNVAVKIPVWESDICLQCGMCSFVCPHAAIRIKAYDPKLLEGAPETFKSIDAKGKDFKGMKFTVQVAPEDCTGCGMCVEVCPGKSKTEEGKKAINMADQIPLRKPESENFEFFLEIPETDPKLFKPTTLKGSQLMRPLFEFSGACAGCGETGYVKLLSQLFGDHLLVGNATGCSSIYGGNLPTTPYCKRKDGRGPAWSNSLFEDNAEFAFGMRLTADKLNKFGLEMVDQLLSSGDSEVAPVKDLLGQIRDADQSTQIGIEEQRNRIIALKEKLGGSNNPAVRELLSLSDFLIRRSVWAVGGDGWAYDIGYGGLDHVLASGRNINALVLDTAVYSNTGGQASKATPTAAVAKFAAGGKSIAKKDLGMLAMTYGNIYVAQVAIGANPAQAVKAFVEADAYDGPSLVIAYSHCIAHGINMTKGLDNQKLAVQCGMWPLYRFNPDLWEQGKNPLQLDSKDVKCKFSDFAYNEIRFRTLKQSQPERAAELMERAEKLVAQRFKLYQNLSQLDCS